MVGELDPVKEPAANQVYDTTDEALRVTVEPMHIEVGDALAITPAPLKL
jgi:hypothetical protein